MRLGLRLATLIFSTVLAACGGEGGKGDAQHPTDQNVQVSDDVRVLEEASRESLIAFELDRSTGGGELRFDANAPGLGALEPGLIVVAEPIPGVAPFGFLQRIVSKRQEGGEVVFETRQATLEETFDEADIEYQVELKPEDLDSTQAHYQGITFQGLSREVGDSASYDFTVDFDKVLIDLDGDHETTDDQLKIDGKFAFSAGVEAKIKIGVEYLVVPTLEHLKFVAYMKEAVDVKLSGALSLDFEEEIKVATYYFGAIVVPVGPVPVVFTLSLDVHVGAKGKLEARIVAKAEQSLQVSVGAEYKKKDGWKNLSSFENEFDFPTPEITAAASARAFAKPTINVAIYGISGPYLSSSAFIEADAELDRDPFWNLHAGMDLGVGFKAELPVIGELANWSEEFELFRLTLGSSPNQAPTIDSISPADGRRLLDGDSLVVGIRATDREQKTLAATLTRGGVEIASTTVERGSVATMSTGALCVGSHTFEVSVVDDKGAVAKETVSVVVENRVPTVTIREDLLGGQTFYNGVYFQAMASAADSGCEETARVNQDLIEWYVDGVRVGESGTLRYQLPPSLRGGDEVILEARYDDGMDVGISEAYVLTVTELPPGTVLPLLVQILSPTHLSQIRTVETLPLRGTAMDPMSGKEIGASSFSWAFSALSGDGWIELPPGTTSTTLHSVYGGYNIGVSHDIRLTVRDGGNEGSDTVFITEIPVG